MRLAPILLAALLLIADGPARAAAVDSPAAKRAMRQQERAVEAAKAECVKSLKAANEALIKSLDAALKEAMGANDLKSANALNALRSAAETDAGRLGRAGDPGALIVAARFGVEGRWADVTERIRGLLRRGEAVVADTAHLVDDPAFGTVKQLQVVLVENGRRRRLTLREGEELPVEPAVNLADLLEPAPDPDAAAPLRAREAVAQHGKAVAAARADLIAALKASDGRLVDDLDAAVKTAMRQNDLEAANALNAVKAKAESNLKVLDDAGDLADALAGGGE